MNRVSFLIDGFNLYHSVNQASFEMKGASTKWLNIRSLLNSYLENMEGRAEIASIHYFSALAHHMEEKHPGTVDRHRTFIRCLEDTGIETHLHNFKAQPIHCQVCGKVFRRNEEKETDVAIGVKLMELLHLNECDTVFLVSGDTDLKPAILTALRIFPEKGVGVIFPYGRKNKALTVVVKTTFKIKKERYLEHQFPNPYVLSSGEAIPKPERW